MSTKSEIENQNRTELQGVDRSALAAFCEFADENRDDVRFELGATGVYEGRAIHTKATTGPYALGGETIDRVAREYATHFGGHREVEAAVGFVDPTDRREVIETALAALTGCLNAALSMSAIARGIELESLETAVRIPWDPSVFLQLEDVTGEDGEPVDMFGDLEVEIDVAVAGDVDEEVRAYLEESVGRSAVFNLLTLAHDADPTVRVTGAE